MGGSLDAKLIATVLIGLFMTGWAYNSLIEYLSDRIHGYTALTVVAGVLVTIGGMALVDWRAAAIALACFAASGTPMVIGDIARTVRRREKAIRIAALIAEAQAKETIEHGET
jgi:hypothetical protein